MSGNGRRAVWHRDVDKLVAPNNKSNSQLSKPQAKRNWNKKIIIRGTGVSHHDGVVQAEVHHVERSVPAHGGRDPLGEEAAPPEIAVLPRHPPEDGGRRGGLGLVGAVRLHLDLRIKNCVSYFEKIKKILISTTKI